MPDIEKACGDKADSGAMHSGTAVRQSGLGGSGPGMALGIAASPSPDRSNGEQASNFISRLYLNCYKKSFEKEVVSATMRTFQARSSAG